MHLRIPLSRQALGLALSVVLATAPSAIAADLPGSVQRIDATRLMFLVEYIGSDYDAAVRDGDVINQLEYGEMLRFSKQAVEVYAVGNRKGDAISGDLDALATDIEKRVDKNAIRTRVRTLLNAISNQLEGVPTPAATPEIAAGGRNFQAECARCHGIDGGGDGPEAKGLEPPVTAFRGERMEQITPRQIYNTLTLGIEGTAMLPFAGKFDEAQRWNLAFFVMTLRDGFRPLVPAVDASLTLEDVAANSNADLLAHLRGRDAAATMEWVDHVRANPPVAGAMASSASAAGTPAVGGDVGVAAALQLQDSFASVADQVFPHVVGVSTRSTVAATEKPAGGWQATAEQPIADPALAGRPVLHAGSGLLLNAQGDIATCDHLVRDEKGNRAEAVTIELRDGQQLTAQVVGMEPALDLAILRVREAEWVRPAGTLEFGDSDLLKTGHWLVAVGDPAGPGATFDVGVVASVAQRQCYQEERTATLLQSSLSIPDPGLGGPIVDIHGKVVGLGVRLPTGDGDETAAAILPVNLLLNLHEALKVAGSDRSPWLGISVLELGLLRQQLGAGAASITIPERGVYIDNVFEPSPATRAGVRRGDFLTALNGRAVASVADFQKALYAGGAGSAAQLELLRDGKPLMLKLPIEERPAEAAMR